jgi:hypothetical protein
VALRVEDARALVEAWEAERRAFTGLRAAVELTVERKGRIDRSAAVLLLAPNRLRLEIAAPFGLPVLVATAGPDQVLVFRPLERSAWMAPATPGAVGRWLGTPVAPEVLIGLLVGHVPSPPGPEAIRIEQNGSRAYIAYERDAVRHRVAVTAQGRPAQLVLDSSERVVATFDWTASNRLQNLHLEVPAQAAQLNLRYLSADEASPVPAAFELTLPRGVRIERAD